MANVARGRLAGAITEAGGLGMIGVGREAPGFIEEQAAIARGDGAGRKFGIGLIVWVIEQQPELLDAAIAQQPFLISISFGDVRPYAERVKRAGIQLVSQVNTRKAAVAAAEAGVDAIVAQGTEAGGHTGAAATLPLLQIVLDSVNRPVIAGGGIAGPAALAAVLAAGAGAGWVGTPFLLSPEADVTDAARERIAAATETDTIHTTVFDRANRLGWPPEFPGRALRNRFAEQWHGREDELMAHPEEIARFREGAERRDYDVTSIFAGQAAGALTQRRPAGDVVRSMGEGAERILRERLRSLLG